MCVIAVALSSARLACVDPGAVDEPTLEVLRRGLPAQHHCATFETLPTILNEAIMKCDEQHRKDIYSNLIVCGVCAPRQLRQLSLRHSLLPRRITAEACGHSLRRSVANNVRRRKLAVPADF